MLGGPNQPGSGKTEEEHRRDICAVGRLLHERGFIVSTEGNCSVRLDAHRLLMTPTCVCKDTMEPDDLVVTDFEGRKLSGARNPSSEIAIHLEIYRRRADVHAVCHAHPPMATGFAAAGVPLDKALLSEVVATLGSVPLVPYATPGTPALAEALAPFVGSHEAVLLANHGVVTWGKDITTAFFHMETTEHFARVTLVTEILGKQVLLSRRDIQALIARRPQCGPAPKEAPFPEDLIASETDCRATLTLRDIEALVEEAVRRDRERR